MNRILSLLAILALLLPSCSQERGSNPPVPPALRAGTDPGIILVLPADAGPGLRLVGQDVLDLMAAIVGLEEGGQPTCTDTLDTSAQAVIRVLVDPTRDALLGAQGYRIRAGDIDGDHVGLQVESATEVGAMYGLYQVMGDLGIRFIHPEETYVPQDAEATLPWHYTGTVQSPDFEMRGFHEHTQHPIVMSDFLLRTDDDSFRDYVSRYLLWLVRNRQNTLTFHLLKTVDLENWLPVITEVREEASQLGIRMGPVLSFADQQQHAFRLIDGETVDPETGGITTDEKQIADGLDRLLEAGFPLLGLQIGTSEFTKPEDQQVLDRLDAALAHVRENHPGVKVYAWVHTTCSLEQDDGDYFYHLPLQADFDLGAFVHTTMFYTLTHPAPVYDCADFGHQVEFLAQASGQREQVYFPETAWWLGFDNNLPLVLPITGFSRMHDIQQTLPQYDVNGHVTFTTGREWGYWKYDHYLTQVTWDNTITWSDYLHWLEPVFGEHGEAVVALEEAWTELQVKHFYQEDPLLYFYLAGELKQDEIGAQAGILARRPKIAFKTVLEFDDEEFAAWYETDYVALEAMLAEYQATLAAPYPEFASAGTPQQQKLVREFARGLTVYVRRIEHTLTLYDAVITAREWVVEEARARTEERTPDESIRAAAQAAAYDGLAQSRTVTTEMKNLFAAAEADYRYPIELLARSKPESLTAYPFGYLEQTSTAHFWQRRDDQLQALLDSLFASVTQSWENEPAVLFAAEPEHVAMTEPDDPMAATVLQGFIPRLLFGFPDKTVADGSLTLLFAEDADTNDLPDPESELLVAGSLADGQFNGSATVVPLKVYDASATEMGSLYLLEALFSLTLEQDSDQKVLALSTGSLAGEVESSGLLALVMTVGGIDSEGAANLVKSVYGIGPEEPLPDRLPFGFSMEFPAP